MRGFGMLIFNILCVVLGMCIFGQCYSCDCLVGHCLAYADWVFGVVVVA